MSVNRYDQMDAAMDKSLPLGRRAAAEGFAAFALVFAGCGAIVADAQYDGVLGAVGVGLVFGLIIMVMVYATGHLSGAHINPAVTVAFTVSRQLTVASQEFLVLGCPPGPGLHTAEHDS